MKHVLSTEGRTQTANRSAEVLPTEAADSALLSEANTLLRGSCASKDSTDYKSSWQRWQSMPGFLEQRRQQLLQKGHLEKRSSERNPTQEALDFFESLLAGTEQTEEDPKNTSVSNTTNGAAQLQDAARRLQEQAEALRSLRQGVVKLDSVASTAKRKPQKEETLNAAGAEGDAVGTAASPKGGVKSFEETFEEREASAEARRKEHQRRLQELEAAAALELEQLRAEIDREHNDAAARRDAQKAWFEEFSEDTRKKKEAAERDARAKAARAFSERDNYWRTRWWRYVPKSDPKEDSHSGCHSGRKHPRPPNFRGPWEKSRHFSGDRREDGNFGSQDRFDSPPSPPSTVEASPILRELLQHREEPLQSRKKIWRALCLRWHPDKSEGQDKDLATRVFQQLSELKPWFLPEA